MRTASMFRCAALAAVLPAISAGAPETSHERRQIVARFVADRVVVDVKLTDGRTVRMFTDTGGGGTFLYAATAERMGLKTRALAPGSGAPRGAAELVQPLTAAPGLPALPDRMLVAPDPFAEMGVASDADGMVGQDWFAGRVWTWDYPRTTLATESPNWRPPRASRPLTVTFKAPGDRRAQQFPRVVVSIAGVPMSMLLDTGATTVLTPEAAAAIGGPRVRGTSMITASTIAGWRAEHPDWRVIERAQERTGARMIEVPDVEIAGLKVGPVWFTERPDANFRKFMSSMTDAPVEGAIGGNALRSLRLTVDYDHGRGAVSRGDAPVDGHGGKPLLR